MEPLYEVTTRYTYYEMKRYDSFWLNKCAHYYLRLAVMMAAFAAVGVIIILCGAGEIGAIFLVGSVAGIILCMTVTTVQRPKQLMKSPFLDKQVTVRFYDERLTVDYDNNHTEYNYSMINQVHETASNFYVVIEPGGGVIITKQNCADELSRFIRRLNPTKKKK